jgi:hypothetical protein
MDSRPLKQSAWILLAFVAFAVTSHAETVVLRDGTVVDGVITSITRDTFRIKTGDMEVDVTWDYLNFEDSLRVWRHKMEQFDPDVVLEFAFFLAKNNLRDDAKAEFEHAAKLDPSLASKAEAGIKLLAAAALCEETSQIADLLDDARQAEKEKNYEGALYSLQQAKSSANVEALSAALAESELRDVKGLDARIAALDEESKKKSGLVELNGKMVTEKKVVEDLKPQKLFEYAVALQEKEDFIRAKNFFKYIVTKYPGTEWAAKAAAKSADNVALIARPLISTGRNENRVDIVIMGDGYTIATNHQRSFAKRAGHLAEFLASQTPIKEYAPYFNFHRLNVASRESGFDTPSRDKDTALGGSEAHGILVVDYGTARAMAEAEVESSCGTGGGGVGCFGDAAFNVGYHEFGHAFVGLSDEYDFPVDGSKAPPGPGPTGINVAGTEDPKKVPWWRWIEKKTRGVGVYEGASYRPKGAWRPMSSCLMRDANSPVCVVCREATIKRVYECVRPIDENYQNTETVKIAGDKSVDIFVVPMKPTTHFLEVKWEAIPKAREGDTTVATSGRALQGRRKTEPGGKVIETLTVSKAAVGTGLWEIVVTVHDPTEWVIHDPDGLLTQKMKWTVEIK